MSKEPPQKKLKQSTILEGFRRQSGEKIDRDTIVLRKRNRGTNNTDQGSDLQTLFLFVSICAPKLFHHSLRLLITLVSTPLLFPRADCDTALCLRTIRICPPPALQACVHTYKGAVVIVLNRPLSWSTLVWDSRDQWGRGSNSKNIWDLCMLCVRVCVGL